jgi:hypothetical protein
MPADRGLAEALADEISDRYRSVRSTLTVELASLIRRALQSGILGDEPRRLALRLLAAVDRDLPGLARTAIERAHQRGRVEAERELAALRRAPRPTPLQVSGRVFDLAQTLRSTHPRIVSWAEQSYRSVVLSASQAEGGTRLQIAQRSWSRLLERGITGFTDASGRRWELASYTEMATRSRLADTAVRAHLDTLAGAGVDLVIVSDAPQECPVCRPWEGKILSRSGSGRRTVEVEHATVDGRTLRVEVAGTVDEAKRAGLMHPSCRHSLSAYLPGLTKPPTRTADPEGDAARQRLRAIERQIRAWKLRAEAAVDPQAGTVAAQRARAWQAKLREHLDAHPTLQRQPRRERIGVAR